MGTRSTIALEYADGTVHQVYCHWDGYLAYNGQMLLKHYSNPFILRDLILEMELGLILQDCWALSACSVCESA